METTAVILQTELSWLTIRNLIEDLEITNIRYGNTVDMKPCKMIEANSLGNIQTLEVDRIGEGFRTSTCLYTPKAISFDIPNKCLVMYL